MDLPKWMAQAIIKYPAHARRAVIALLTAFDMAIVYMLFRISTYFDAVQQWNVMWGNSKVNQQYIAAMRSVGLPPNWEIPPRPTFWGVEFTTVTWVTYAVVSILAFCTFTMLLNWLLGPIRRPAMDRKDTQNG